MTVRRHIHVIVAACGLWLLAGCGRGDGGVQIAETDESVYQQGKQLLRQGREAEALANFLKVIEARGERAAPESHFEAGLIYLRHMKDPVEAIHHFKRYVDYPPANSRQVQSVRELINTARREFAATLPGPLLEGQTTRVDSIAELETLRRENEELRAEIATLRGSAGGNRGKAGRLMLSLDPVTPSVPANTPSSSNPAGGPGFTPAPSRPTDNVFQPAPAPTPTAPRTAGANSRSTPTATGRTHTLRAKETLYGIARQYGVSADALQRANGITDPSKVKEGTVLKIP